MGRWLLSIVVLAGPAAAQGESLWSLRPVSRPPLPEVVDETWPRNGIDRFVLARLDGAGLSPSPEADTATLNRRLHLVLHGLPPESEAPKASFEERVEALLASPHYGERWARHWLDLARFAETHGGETNTPRPNAWPYRDWVIQALNEDLPYDEFLFAQVAGDTIGVDAATGFLVAGAWDTVKSPDVVLTRNQRQDELSDMVNATTAGFLGLTVACARCHDHKFDPVSQRDYYAVQALFSGVQHGDRPWRRPAESARLAELQVRLAEVDTELEEQAATAAPPPRTPGLVVIDDEDPTRTRVLVPVAGHGDNPAGAARGERDDAGDIERGPNLSRGRYSVWLDPDDVELYEVTPGVSGPHRVWVSWGAGWDNHAQGAEWWLDGELLATVDQRQFADGSDAVRQVPLWSGLLDVGVHELSETSRLVLRPGSLDGQPTADVVLLAPPGTDAPRLRGPVDAKANEERFAAVEATALRMVVTATVAPVEPCIDELEVFAGGTNVAPGAAVRTSGDYQGNPKHRPEHINDGRYGNDRSWISNTPGAGWVELGWSEPVTVDRVTWARDREGRYADRLARDYTIEVRAGDGPWRVVASSGDRLRSALESPRDRFAGCADPQRVRALLAERAELVSEQATLSTRPLVYAGVFAEPEPTRLLHRGDPMQPTDVVAPDLPQALGSLGLAAGAPEAERRAAFARWLGDRRNPLTARVVVNRLWAHQFGEGLVVTPSNFGALGVPPSHPQLLDWLAAELMDSGWSLKHVQRLIVTSSTWRQSTARDERALGVDTDARLLWRYPSRRIEAEVLRDMMLAASGALDRSMGGPGYSAFEPNTNYVRNYVPRADFAPDGFRRMIYMTKVRMERDATFGVFDTPDAGQICAQRGRSTTPLQALALFNSPFVRDQAERLGARLVADVPEGGDARLARAFQLVLGRGPGPEDLAEARGLVETHGWPALGRALFNCNEFLFLP
jgi:hypothetical protein